MKTRYPLRNRRRRGQAGWTIIEVTVVLVVAATILMGIMAGVVSFVNNSNYNQAQTFLAEQFPRNAFAIFGRRGTINGSDKNDFVQTGASPETAWRENWTMNACANNQCVIQYPISEASDPDIFGNDLVAYLTQQRSGEPVFEQVVNAAYNAGSQTLTVTYQVR